MIKYIIILIFLISTAAYAHETDVWKHGPYKTEINGMKTCAGYEMWKFRTDNKWRVVQWVKDKEHALHYAPEFTFKEANCLDALNTIIEETK